MRAADVSAAFSTLVANLQPLVRATGKQLLFTQVGYPSCRNCGQKGALRRYLEVDEDCQVNAYEGILDALTGSASAQAVAGLYFWNWLPCTAPSGDCAIGDADNGETPQAKRAEQVLRDRYASLAARRDKAIEH